MSIFDREPSQEEIRAIQDLFNRTVEAERELLSDEQKAGPRKYLQELWLECAAVVTAEIPGKYGKAGLRRVPAVPVEQNESAVRQMEEDEVPF